VSNLTRSSTPTRGRSHRRARASTCCFFPSMSRMSSSAKSCCLPFTRRAGSARRSRCGVDVEVHEIMWPGGMYTINTQLSYHDATHVYQLAWRVAWRRQRVPVHAMHCVGATLFINTRLALK
jgi:hypothetical protein